MDTTDQKSKENKIVLILRWVFGILFILNGIGSIFSEPISGLIMLIMAAILLPPVSKLVEKKWKFHLSKGVKIAILIIGFIILGVTDDTSNTEQNNKTKNVSQETKQEETKQELKEVEEQESESEEVVKEEEQKPEIQKIGVSYDQMMNYLSNFFVMEKSTPVNGQSRYTGQTSSGLAILEIIGDKQNINQATLIFGVPDDSPETVVTNSAIMLRFLKNAVPEWENSSDWVTEALDEINNSATDSKEKIYGDKIIKISVAESLGMIVIVVEHK